MGALPQFSVLFQFFFQKSPTGGTIYEYIGKYKEIEGQIAHDFFFLRNGHFKKKNWWAHNGRSAHEIKKIKMGASKKKKRWAAPIFWKSNFFAPMIPQSLLLSF